MNGQDYIDARKYSAGVLERFEPFFRVLRPYQKDHIGAMLVDAFNAGISNERESRDRRMGEILSRVKP